MPNHNNILEVFKKVCLRVEHSSQERLKRTF